MITFSKRGAAKSKSKQFSEFGIRTTTAGSSRVHKSCGDVQLKCRSLREFLRGTVKKSGGARFNVSHCIRVLE